MPPIFGGQREMSWWPRPALSTERERPEGAQRRSAVESRPIASGISHHHSRETRESRVQ